MLRASDHIAADSMPPSCGEAELDTHTQTPSGDSICTHNDEKLAAQLAEQLQLRHRDEPGDSGANALHNAAVRAITISIVRLLLLQAGYLEQL